MPILTQEVDLYPEDLLEREYLGEETDACWWALYTRPRREKDLMRRLLSLEIPFCGPTVAKRHRSPSGRLRTSYLPLFPNYVFIYGGGQPRYDAMTTNCVMQHLPVPDGLALTGDLRRIFHLIRSGRPVTLEERLQPGMPVRVRSGPLRGREGVVVARRGRRRLVVNVDFLQQGASVELEDCEVERID